MSVKTTFARKYRPKKFSDVVGQDDVVRGLTNAFKAKNLHHAYIFGGQFGCGKTSLARILAAMDNCLPKRTLEPCGTCDNCRDIFSGRSVDVKEVDAATVGSIENIRSIRDEIRQNPLTCRVKYVILDEAHRLSGPAAEAALKMIEEPPPHVRFILCTTDDHLLKDTIHSRCIPFKFNKVSWKDLEAHLKKVTEAEGFEYEDGALKIAARYSKGSVRNSLQNLQTIINYSGGAPLTAEAAKSALGAIDDSLYFNLVESMIKINVPQGMKVIESIFKGGTPAGEVLSGIHHHIRCLILAQVCSSAIPGLGMSEEEVKKIEVQASSAGLSFLLRLSSLLTDVSRRISLNLDPQSVFEEFLINGVIEKRKIDAKNN